MDTTLYKSYYYHYFCYLFFSRLPHIPFPLWDVIFQFVQRKVDFSREFKLKRVFLRIFERRKLNKSRFFLCISVLLSFFSLKDALKFGQQAKNVRIPSPTDMPRSKTPYKLSNVGKQIIAWQFKWPHTENKTIQVCQYPKSGTISNIH